MSSVVAIKVTGDAEGAKRALKEAAVAAQTFSEQVSAKMAGVGESFRIVGDRAVDMGKNLTAKVTLPLLGVGGAAFKMAADVQDAQGAVDQIFQSNSDTVKKWADNLPSYYGIAEGEALGYASTMGSMLKNIGQLTEEEAAAQVQALIPLAGDLAAMFGGSTQDAMYALQGALKGNTTMLDNYGMTATQAQIQAKALEMGLVGQGQEMDAAAKQAATLALIMEQSSDAQGQASREAQGASGQMRSFTTEIKNLAGDIGEKLLPVFTPMIAKVREWVDRFSKLDEKTQNIILVVAGLAAALGPVLIVLGKVSSGIGSMITVGGKLIATAGKLKTAVMGMNTAFLSSPIFWVIAAAAALIATFVVMYQKVDWFRDGVDALWAKLKVAFGWINDNVIPVIVNVAQWIGEKAVQAAKKLSDFITQTLWPAFKKIVDFITTYVVPIFVRVGSAMWETAQFIGNAIASIVGFIWNLPGRIAGTISTLWNGLINGITVAKNWVVQKFFDILGFIGGLPGAIRDLTSGMWDGLKNGFKSVMNWLSDMWNRSIGSLSFTVPSWIPSIGGKKFSIPKMPTLHDGGVVNALGRDETLRVLKHGETVLPTHKAGFSLGGGGTTIVLNVAGSVLSERDLVDVVQKGMKRNQVLYGR